MKAGEWIDRVKEARGWDSDYKVAKELEVSRQTVSTYRSRPDATMDEETAVKVAEALRIEPHLIVLDQVAERSKVEAVRTSIGGLLERLSGKVLPAAGGGRGRLDITSVTLAGGAPEAGPGRTGIRIASSGASIVRAMLQQLVTPAAPAIPLQGASWHPAAA